MTVLADTKGSHALTEMRKRKEGVGEGKVRGDNNEVIPEPRQELPSTVTDLQSRNSAFVV